MIHVGITERGDASLDYSWYDYILNKKVDGVILITKHITPYFREKVCELRDKNYPVIIHATCTGWGGTPMEPNVPFYKVQLHNLLEMILNDGIPIDNCVLRVDPIIPNDEGIQTANNVLSYARYLGIIPNIRVRVSVLDTYPHVIQRASKRNIVLPTSSIQKAQSVLLELAQKNPDVIFETCAEPDVELENVKQIGCVSRKDLDILGLDEYLLGVNPQHRKGCLCLSCKKEMLSGKHPCAHNCAYCYWKDINT